jgi:hypothetical protein
MGLKSLLRIVTGTRGQPPGSDPDAPEKRQRSAWAESVQSRRWQEAIATTALPKS